uniref:Uncharacterized protein n=1 Tax=Ciona savignyi TaxID=51511 RepID=H2YKY8_CIOSA
MVKSETLEHRLLCLKVLRRTDNQACLRSFLQLHGLPLLWSWMVDLTSSPHINDITSYFRLKLEILSVLFMLPITSLNILQDSKVISMVRRWAEEDPPTIIPTESESETKVNDENSVEPQTSDKVDVDSGEDKDENVETVEVPNPALKDDPPQEEGNTPDKLGDLSSEVVKASENLLDSWKDLKEIYRIPKRQQSVDPTLGGESERSVEDRSSSQTSSPSVANQMDGNTGYYEEERHREYSSEKDWRGREDNWGSR